ncbi:hypothetical protein KTT_00510 [Tengunoibacter tsumagoiensis]|uniref:Uncharacterized protein n=1 Tax=Tengunoibacter tsumagoiensis TaxID=2014871 RepID=A0A401ZTQ7_9CHLR|nr:hypothetical protein KTT_00510 [Tengunoibacter tsumagoiensis]
MRPKREGRFKGSRALAAGNEAGTTDRLRVSSGTFEYEKGSSIIAARRLALLVILLLKAVTNYYE